MAAHRCSRALIRQIATRRPRGRRHRHPACRKPTGLSPQRLLESGGGQSRRRCWPRGTRRRCRPTMPKARACHGRRAAWCWRWPGTHPSPRGQCFARTAGDWSAIRDAARSRSGAPQRAMQLRFVTRADRQASTRSTAPPRGRGLISRCCRRDGSYPPRAAGVRRQRHAGARRSAMEMLLRRARRAARCTSLTAPGVRRTHHGRRAGARSTASRRRGARLLLSPRDDSVIAGRRRARQASVDPASASADSIIVDRRHGYRPCRRARTTPLSEAMPGTEVQAQLLGKSVGPHAARSGPMGASVRACR